MKSKTPQGQLHRAQYRIPADLAQWLSAEAEKNTRSLNGELVAKLKQTRQRELQETAHAN